MHFAGVQEDAFAMDEDGVLVPGHNILQDFPFVGLDPLVRLEGDSSCCRLQSKTRQCDCATKLQDTLHLERKQSVTSLMVRRARSIFVHHTVGTPTEHIIQ